MGLVWASACSANKQAVSRARTIRRLILMRPFYKTIWLRSHAAHAFLLFLFLFLFLFLVLLFGIPGNEFEDENEDEDEEDWVQLHSSRYRAFAKSYPPTPDVPAS